MKITALVENHSHGELKPKHGLSLYIETSKHRVLFDLGMGNTLFEIIMFQSACRIECEACQSSAS